MDFPKKQAQRLMPLYLLEYSEKLFTNHPDPSAPWGGGGSDYTAGQGITITNNEISVDTNVIATKSDISPMVTTTQLNDALDDYALKTEIPTDVSQLYNDAGYATETWVQNQGYATSSEIPTNYVTTNTDQTISGAKTFDGGPICSSLGGAYTMQPLGVGVFRVNDVNSTKQIDFSLPIEKSGTEYTLATTDDIPTTATSTSTSTVTPTTGTFVTGTSTNTTNVVNSVTYTPSAETLTFTYDDNTTASFTFLTSSTTVTSDITSVVTSVTDSTSNAMTGATVSTSTTTTLS